MAAQFDNFPLIDIDDLPKVLYSIGMLGMARAEPVSKAVIKKYRSLIEQPSD